MMCLKLHHASAHPAARHPPPPSAGPGQAAPASLVNPRTSAPRIRSPTHRPPMRLPPPPPAGPGQAARVCGVHHEPRRGTGCQGGAGGWMVALVGSGVLWDEGLCGVHHEPRRGAGCQGGAGEEGPLGFRVVCLQGCVAGAWTCWVAEEGGRWAPSLSFRRSIVQWLVLSTLPMSVWWAGAGATIVIYKHIQQAGSAQLQRCIGAPADCVLASSSFRYSPFMLPSRGLCAGERGRQRHQGDGGPRKPPRQRGRAGHHW